VEHTSKGDRIICQIDNCPIGISTEEINTTSIKKMREHGRIMKMMAGIKEGEEK